jgi:bla regulator protein blaR1
LLRLSKQIFDPNLTGGLRLLKRLRLRPAVKTTLASAALFAAVLFANAQPTPATATQPPAWQTAAGGHMEFEVASIRPAGPGAHGPMNIDLSVEDSPFPPGGRFAMVGAASSLVLFAYKLSPVAPQNQITFQNMAKWVTAERFDLEARAPMDNPTKDQLRLMMQALLADRFKLTAHFEIRDVPAMALVLINPGKPGPRLRPHSEGPACDAKIPPVDRSSPKIPDVWMPICGSTQLVDWTNHTVILGSRNTTMDYFADWIPSLGQVDRPVVNQTGLAGRFDIEVNFTPYWVREKMQSADAQLDLTGPTFLEGLKNDLGLKLIPTHASVRTLVVDHVEEPTPN